MLELIDDVAILSVFHIKLAPMSTDERRGAQRHEYDCPVLIARNDDGFLGHIDNVSATGCRVTRPHDWSLDNGTEVRLYLMIDGSHVFGAQASVVWSSSEFIGFEYLEPQALPT